MVCTSSIARKSLKKVVRGMDDGPFACFTAERNGTALLLGSYLAYGLRSRGLSNDDAITCSKIISHYWVIGT